MDEFPHPAAGERYRAPALDKGLDILEILAGQARGLTRAEIVREMGLNPSQIYRMLERLVARGYVARIDGDRYALSMKLYLVATQLPPQRRLVAQAQPLMDEFARAERQSCHLVMPDQGAGIIVAQASPGGHWEFRARLGGELDLFATGSGLILLAFQRPDRAAETLGGWGVADAGPRLSALADRLARIRAEGIRAEASSHLVGVTDLSVPVLGPGAEAVAALTCAYIEHPGEAGGTARARAQSALLALGRALSQA